MEAATVPSGDTRKSLEPYGQLIRMLLPRTASIDIFDPRGELYWSSNSIDGPDLQPLVDAVCTGQNEDESGLFKQLDDGTPVYLFQLFDEYTEPLALLALTLRTSGSDIKDWSFVNSLLRPALECLQRELSVQTHIDALQQSLAAHDKDLDLLLAVTSDNKKTAETSTDNAGDDTDELRWIVQRSVDHLNALIGALVIPEKGIAICRAGENVPAAQSTEVLTRTHRHLMTWAQLQGKALVVNKVAATDHPGALPYKILSCPVRQSSNRVVGFFALFRTENMEDFDHRHTRVARLLARKAAATLQANYDSATGLLTRAAFDRLAAATQRRMPSAQHCVVYLDIDQMHVINENFGMHIGDAVIARVAELVRRAPHPRAISARLSADRFALMLPECELTQAAEVARKICDSARQISAERVGEQAPEVSLSVGVAALGANKGKLTHVLAAAEVACKAAKDRGRDRVEVYEDADASIVRRYTDINVVAQLREALRNNEFSLELQPILPLQNEAKEPHFELLLRMNNGEGQPLAPEKFLPAAARYQLMPAIDRWVVEHALSKLSGHGQLISENRACFTINISAPSLAQPDFADFVESAVKGSGLPPDTLCFELTETAAVANMRRAQDFMKRMCDLGCTFALDDFGSGFSSLAYLKALPVSILKIDGSFIRDLLTDTRSQSMVRAIAQLARTMCMETVAEYVETDEIRRRVTALGVDFGQGFCLGKPRPFADVLRDLPIFEAFAQSSRRDTGSMTGRLLALKERRA